MSKATWRGMVLIAGTKAKALGYKCLSGPYYVDGYKTLVGERETYLLERCIGDLRGADTLLVDGGQGGVEVWRNAKELIMDDICKGRVLSAKQREALAVKDLGAGAYIEKRRRSA